MATNTTTLMAKIDEALAGVEKTGGDRLPYMASIKEQLLWCRSYLSGSPPFPTTGAILDGAHRHAEFRDVWPQPRSRASDQ